MSPFFNFTTRHQMKYAHAKANVKCDCTILQRLISHKILLFCKMVTLISVCTQTHMYQIHNAPTYFAFTHALSLPLQPHAQALPLLPRHTPPQRIQRSSTNAMQCYAVALAKAKGKHTYGATALLIFFDK